MGKTLQTTFINGMDFIAPDFQVSEFGYKMLINARQRFGYIEPNKKPLKDTNIPSGKKQGGITIGEVKIVFISGEAWYNEDGTSLWLKIPNFLMDENVDRYYSISVPSGTVNYSRKMGLNNGIGDAGVDIRKVYDITVSGTPAAILVQDGVNQPWVIIFDSSTNTFTSRETQDYEDWQNDGIHNEYVPIGKQMLIVDQKLYIVSPDNKRLYQSISGRYLDFMVNVDVNGNKLSSEDVGGATSVSFAFDSTEITCIAPTSIPSSFIYATAKTLRIITLDYNRRIFGEPTYFVTAPLDVGTVNQDSIVELLGDTAVVDFEGVKSFNAVEQLNVEGNNSIFSLQLSRILKRPNESKPIKQTRPRCVSFNNYAIFNLDTIYGNILVIYDTLLEKWVALDITEVYAIKQFLILETEFEIKLFAINELDDFYQLYGSTVNEVAQLHTRAIAVADEETGKLNPTITQKSELLKLYFQGGNSTGKVYATELVDGQKSINRLNKELVTKTAGITFPMSFPIGFDSAPTSEPLTLTLKEGKRGHKLSYIIQWDTDAQLQAFELQTSEEKHVVSKLQKERGYANS